MHGEVSGNVWTDVQVCGEPNGGKVTPTKLGNDLVAIVENISNIHGMITT
jgi:hypothetical protein